MHIYTLTLRRPHTMFHRFPAFLAEENPNIHIFKRFFSLKQPIARKRLPKKKVMLLSREHWLELP
jgi:hypothetical protein